MKRLWLILLLGCSCSYTYNRNALPPSSEAPGDFKFAATTVPARLPMARKLASSPAPRLQSFQAARQTVTVAWDSSAGATGYKLYWGTNSAVYRNVMSLTNLQAALQLEPLTTYFMAVTAENGLGAESPYSDELIFTTAAAIPTGVLVEVSILGADAVSGPYIPMSLTNSITEALTNGQRYYRALMTITPR